MIDVAPGHWWTVRPEGTKWNAIIDCPQCGRPLGLTHTIHGDGTTQQSVICTWAGCAFHDHVRLVGWRGIWTLTGYVQAGKAPT